MASDTEKVSEAILRLRSVCKRFERSARRVQFQAELGDVSLGAGFVKDSKVVFAFLAFGVDRREDRPGWFALAWKSATCSAHRINRRLMIITHLEPVCPLSGEELR